MGASTYDNKLYFLHTLTLCLFRVLYYCNILTLNDYPQDSVICSRLNFFLHILECSKLDFAIICKKCKNFTVHTLDAHHASVLSMPSSLTTGERVHFLNEFSFAGRRRIGVCHLHVIGLWPQRWRGATAFSRDRKPTRSHDVIR